MNRGGEMNRYALVTEWQLLAPINRVWDALYDVAAWPRWWKYVLAVEELEKGDAAGVGALRRYTWSSRLPYRLTFNTRSTVVDKPHVLAGEAVGELTGACPGAGVSLESWRRHGGRGAWAGEPSGRRAVGGIGAQPVCGRHAAGMWPVRSRYGRAGPRLSGAEIRPQGVHPQFLGVAGGPSQRSVPQQTGCPAGHGNDGEALLVDLIFEIRQ